MEECLQKYWDTLNPYIEKFAPKDTKYSWEDFRADLNTYKTIGLVLATTLMPNVLSETQVEAGGIMALREMQRKQAAELAARAGGRAGRRRARSAGARGAAARLEAQALAKIVGFCQAALLLAFYL